MRTSLAVQIAYIPASEKAFSGLLRPARAVRLRSIAPTEPSVDIK